MNVLTHAPRGATESVQKSRFWRGWMADEALSARLDAMDGELPHGRMDWRWWIAIGGAFWAGVCLCL